MKAANIIEKKISRLSPSSLAELDHYVDYLINKKQMRSSRHLTQNWADGLNDIDISSLELQKKALEWRKIQSRF